MLRTSTHRLFVTALALAWALAACTPSADEQADTTVQLPEGSMSPSQSSSAMANVATSESRASSAPSGDDEDSLQLGQGVNGVSELPESTYEQAIQTPPGIYQKPYKDDPDYDRKNQEWEANIKAELKKITPVLPKGLKDRDDPRIATMLAKILYLVGRKHEVLETPDKWGYLIFKDSGDNPFNHEPVVETNNVNIEIVLDASGSMAANIDGRTMMDIAKESITNVVNQLPPHAKVGLRVFGHRGTNKKAGKAESCAANELVAPIASNNSAQVADALGSIQPTGWTSIAQSIAMGSEDLTHQSAEKDLNILYIVTDGIETCDGDPVGIAQQVKAANTNVVMGIIGFNVDANQDKELRAIAESGGGYYANANDAVNLTSELQRIHELSNSTYQWQPLDYPLKDNVWKSQHEGVTANFDLYNSYSEEYHDVILEALKLGKEVGIDSGDDYVSYLLETKARARYDEIFKQFKARRSEIEKASNDYLQSLDQYLGQTVAYIPPTSRYMQSSQYYIPRKERVGGGVSDAPSE
ncbi:vWA domain-containing protein [Stomatohabitans albus]|uniref:vWA domain-containing protein n=1 Tax=Stomatohabitans albus TaxID=3110766 RepID=UPI00300D0CCD